MMSVKNRLGLQTLLLITVFVTVALLYIVAVTPQSFGFYHDDSIYVATAKSLATGQGYRIISLPGEPVQTKSPPVYPVLLSLIWRVYPHFPENLTTMMMLSVMATLAALALTWVYLTKQGYAPKWMALIVVGMTAINPRTVTLATGLYSEMSYMALSIGGLYLAEEYGRDYRSWTRGATLGCVTGLTFLTRPVGLTLLVAVTVYYGFRKQFSKAVIPLMVGGIFVLAWMFWGYVGRDMGGGVNAAYYESYFQTVSTVVADSQAQNNESTLSIWLGIITKNINGLILSSVPIVSLGVKYGWEKTLGGRWEIFFVCVIFCTFALVAVGFLKDISTRVRVLHIYVVLYLGFHLLWPYASYDRFLMPLLPFLLLWLITQIGTLMRLIRKVSAARGQVGTTAGAVFVGLIVLAVMSVSLYSHGSSLYRTQLCFNKPSAGPASEDAEVISWIKEHTDASDIVVCYRDPLYYLYTGRKATRSSILKEGGNISSQQRDQYERAKGIFRIIEENSPRYLVFTPSDFDLEADAVAYRETFKMLLDENADIFVEVFKSTDGHSFIYRIEREAIKEGQNQATESREHLLREQ